MAIIRYENVKISGISAVVPTQRINNLDYSSFFSRKEAESIIKMTGIAERRFAPKSTTAADMCTFAASKLFTDMNIASEEIDAIIFVSLTPDYRMPGSAFVIHKNLKLKKSAFAYDLSLGCSGYINGLAQAFNLASIEGINKVLLLNGETKSKTYSREDKSTTLLFGDGATATLVEKTSLKNKTIISLNSDGSRSDAIIIRGGGYRNPTSKDTLQYRSFLDGSKRNLEQGEMDGPAIFDFTITEVPRDIQNVLNVYQMEPSDIDHVILHQANRFITDHIRKKLKIDKDKVVYSLQKFGNTASVSIPLTIVSELQNSLLSRKKKVLMSGFGVGLSWGSIITDLDNCFISELQET
jgi:3-oxoacyl-[acyl-carrier-protein] synthase III